MLLPGKRLIGFLPLLLLSVLAFSQEIEPYSRFALGQTANSVFSASKGMGGLAAAYRDQFYINFLNPASYSSLSLTTLETGVKFTTQKIKDGQTGKSYRAGDGFFDHFALGVPIGKRAGLSMGLLPYSYMQYDFEQTKIYDIGSSQKLYQGSGTIYQLYFGGGYRFPKMDTSVNLFSVGMNVVYLFGKTDRSDILEFSPQDYYNMRITSSARMNNLALNIGVQYRRDLSKKVYGLLGAYVYAPVSVSSTQNESWARYLKLSSGIFIIDTVHAAKTDVPGMKIPVEAGAGLSFGEKNHWMIGAEFRYKMWSEVESFSTDATLEDSWEVRAGAELRPNAISTKFLNRVAYRLGGFYDAGYLNIDGTKIPEFGATFGFGIPLKTSFARLNFSFDAGSRGTTANQLIKETFLRAYIGFTFNDKWFLKPKYD